MSEKVWPPLPPVGDFVQLDDGGVFHHVEWGKFGMIRGFSFDWSQIGGRVISHGTIHWREANPDYGDRDEAMQHTAYEERVEALAREICDTYYLTVDPANVMQDAFSKITEKTRQHWRAQARLMIGRGVR